MPGGGAGAASGRLECAAEHVEHRIATLEHTHVRTHIGLAPANVGGNERIEQTQIAGSACRAPNVVEDADEAVERTAFLAVKVGRGHSSSPSVMVRLVPSRR